MVYRSWQILKNDNPVVQTSMSETWGEFPTFQCCDIRMHGKPRLQLCSLTQLEQPEGKHDPGKDSSFQTFQCMHNTGKIRYMKSAWSKEHGHCFLVEMRSFSPNATVEHPSKVMLQFSLPVFHEEGQYGEGRLNLFAAEPNQKLQTLASLYPGNSDLLLTKVKTGSISLFNDPFSWKTWKNAVFPNLKSVYTTNLQAFGPDHGVFKQKLVKKKTHRFQMATRRQRRRDLSELQANTVSQHAACRGTGGDRSTCANSLFDGSRRWMDVSAHGHPWVFLGAEKHRSLPLEMVMCFSWIGIPARHCST